jgi:cytochrome c553
MSRRMLLLAAAGLGALAVFVVVSGVIPIKASSGHWWITEKILHFVMQQSVRTHAITVSTPPPLDDRALVLRGAGHYDLGCAPCHGAVASAMPRIPRAMTPHPPELPLRVGRWSDAQLFYIVKHGVKFTGMPAWPAQQRDDEVWAVVAFLRQLPELDAHGYEQLARGTSNEIWALPPGAAESPDVVVEICARCHGLDGLGRGAGGSPKLAGQSREYMDLAMRAYAEGRRYSGVMGPIAVSLDAAERAAAVRYYASLESGSGVGTGHASMATAGSDADPSTGAEIATRGLPARGVPACVECHSPVPGAKNPAYPRLHGQYPEYLALQLRLLRERRRGGSEYVHLMHGFVGQLTDEQVDDVAAYLGS